MKDARWTAVVEVLAAIAAAAAEGRPDVAADIRARCETIIGEWIADSRNAEPHAGPDLVAEFLRRFADERATG